RHGLLSASSGSRPRSPKPRGRVRHPHAGPCRLVYLAANAPPPTPLTAEGYRKRDTSATQISPPTVTRWCGLVLARVAQSGRSHSLKRNASVSSSLTPSTVQGRALAHPVGQSRTPPRTCERTVVAGHTRNTQAIHPRHPHVPFA